MIESSVTARTDLGTGSRAQQRQAHRLPSANIARTASCVLSQTRPFEGFDLPSDRRLSRCVVGVPRGQPLQRLDLLTDLLCCFHPLCSHRPPRGTSDSDFHDRSTRVFTTATSHADRTAARFVVQGKGEPLFSVAPVRVIAPPKGFEVQLARVGAAAPLATLPSNTAARWRRAAVVDPCKPGNAQRTAARLQAQRQTIGPLPLSGEPPLDDRSPGPLDDPSDDVNPPLVTPPLP